MAKVLCLFALVVSAIIFLIFFLDLILGIPFARVSMIMDIGFVVSSVIIGVFSFLTFQEQR
ncbi:MAG: hypothetical protein FWD31_06490 [Planctomycetaceae bacterium]|nr:hypothetical protein [Planctomycetaceae bacterium]